MLELWNFKFIDINKYQSDKNNLQVASCQGFDQKEGRSVLDEEQCVIHLPGLISAVLIETLPNFISPLQTAV